jgi:hypothetical protein
LIAREKTGGSTKSLHLISTSPEKEPETFDIEIMQPPTRDDWITGIREAVDACTPGSDSEDAGIGSEEELRKRHVQVVKYKLYMKPFLARITYFRFGHLFLQPRNRIFNNGLFSIYLD